MKLKHLKLFEAFDEEEVKHPESFSQGEEQAIDDANALADAGVISQEAADEVRKSIVKKHRANIKRTYQKEIGSDTGIEHETWLNSKYGRVLSSELADAVKNEAFAELKAKGFRVEKMSLDQAMKGNLVLYVPGNPTKMGISKSGLTVRRILSTSGTTQLKNYPTGTKDFYQLAFDYVNQNIDPSDPDMATYRGAKMKKKWSAEIRRIKENILATYASLVGEKVAAIIFDRVNETIYSHWENQPTMAIMTSHTNLKGVENKTVSMAKNGILYLPISSYDNFFTRQLENIFVEHDVKWAPTSFLHVGTITNRFGNTSNERRHDLFYTALNTVEFVLSPKTLYINADQVSDRMIAKLQEKGANIDYYHNR